MKTVKQLSSYEMIWEIVRQIPRGKVATYGQVASESGFPGQARLVGYALHSLPLHMDVPWQRVINAQGRISFAYGTREHRRQRRLLTGEGVKFQGEIIDLDRFGWLKASRRQ